MRALAKSIRRIEVPFTHPRIAKFVDLSPRNTTLARPASSRVNQEIPRTAPALGAPTSRLFLRAALALGTSLVAVLVVYLAFNVPGAWFPSASPKTFDAAQMAVSRGQVQVTQGALQVAPAAGDDAVVIVLRADLRSSDFAGIEWNVAGLPGDADVRLIWRTSYQPERLNLATMTVDDGRLRPIVMSRDPAWIGTIAGLGLAVRGTMRAPIEIRGVTAKPLGAFELAQSRMAEWLAFEGWRATSVETLAGGAEVQDLPLPVVLALAALLVLAAYALKLRFAPAPGSVPWPVFAVAVFAVAWLVADLRFAWNAARQSLVTARTYAGTDWREAHLAAEDAALFKLVEDAKAKMPAAPTRVFVLAEAPYFRARSAYYFYPHYPWFDVYRNTGPEAGTLRPGDYVFAYRRRGVQFNQALGRLRWEGGTDLAAEAVLLGGEGALFLLK